MAKYLVIVESPNKTHKIQQYLGKDYDVIASVGHFRDLPQKQFGVDIKNNFEPTYETMPDKKDVVTNIVSKAKKSQMVYLATDADREGEFISFHISEILPKGTKTKRIRYQEITKNALEKAIKEATDIDMDLVYAAETRRILDRVVGFKCSYPVKQATGGPSAGRVQSAVLRFLAEKEKEIKSFIPVTYWEIIAELLTKNKQKITANLTKPEKLDVNTEEMAKKILDRLKKGPIKVSSYDRKEASVKPYAPFVSSTIQQAASSFLGWSPKKTMQVAQQLFSQSLITYHRSDSYFINPEFVMSIRDTISSEYGKNYIPASQLHYASSKNAQEAHEAIRPTDLSNRSGGTGDLQKLYIMIWKRTMASQMADAKYLRSKAEFSCDNYLLSVSGSSCTFEGWRKCWDYGSSDDYVVPELKVGDVLDLIDSSMTEEKTKPPSRYSEASCIKHMEQLGIGRPSTYANTLETLKDRKYIDIQKKAINVSDLGINVTDFLVSTNFCFANLEFTAMMEEDLDRVARAEENKLCVLTKFYKTIQEDLKRCKGVKEEQSKTEFPCPECSKDGVKSFLVKKFSKFGPFLSCEKYSKKDDGCKYTAQVGPDGKPKEKINKVKELSGIKCPKCKADLLIRHGKFGDFLGCSKFPKCQGIYDTDGVEKKSGKKKWNKFSKKKKKDEDSDEE